MWTSCRVPLLSGTVPGLSGRVRLRSYLEFLLFRLRAISLTACAWDITILKPYCMKKTEREQDVVTKKPEHAHLCGSLLCFLYLIVHDCSQAHDANMHIIFLADKAGVLDGFAVGNWAIAVIDERGRYPVMWNLMFYWSFFLDFYTMVMWLLS